MVLAGIAALVLAPLVLGGGTAGTWLYALALMFLVARADRPAGPKRVVVPEAVAIDAGSDS